MTGYDDTCVSGGVVVAAPASGAGKTTVTLASIAAARARGLVVQPFKVGPDFIDPGHLSRAAERPAGCLDGWMLGRTASVASFAQATADADCAFVEGMMGLYDGLAGAEETASTAEIAKWLDLPVILVVDAGAMARSVAALVRGFRDFDAAIRLAGVVFDRIGGAGHLAFLREALATIDVACLGGLPFDAACEIPERHLGLRTAAEATIPLARLAETAARHLDVDRILALARTRRRTAGDAADGAGAPATATRAAAGTGFDRVSACSHVDPQRRSAPATTVAGAAGAHERSASVAPAIARGSAASPLVAVARDQAFSFYYRENLEALARAGATLVEWSPLADAALPCGTAALYLGGGYPELHAATLARNVAMLAALRTFAASGGVVYAECGGLMLLAATLVDAAGAVHRMAGVLPFTTRMHAGGMTLGYREVTIAGSSWLPRLDARGHEFHHSTLDEATVPATLARVYAVRDPRSGRTAREGFSVGRVLASYVHLHFASAPGLAPALVAAATADGRPR